MILPLTVATVAVSLGTLIALGPKEGSRWMGPVRVIALVSAIAVIAVHLMPEAVSALGVVAFAWLVLGAALPVLVQLLVRLAFRTPPSEPGRAGALAALELGYFGLLVHRFGDGLSMGAVEYATSSLLAKVAVLLALAAHIVPVTTMMLFLVRDLRGKRSAWLRGLGLLVATLAGVACVSLIGASAEEPLPWLSALVAGLLLHVVLHEVPVRKRAATES